MRLKRCISSGMHTSAQYGWNYAFNKRMGTFLDAKKDEAPQNEYLNRFVVMGIWWLSFNLFKCVIYQVGTNGKYQRKKPGHQHLMMKKKKVDKRKIDITTRSETWNTNHLRWSCYYHLQNKTKRIQFPATACIWFYFIFMVSVCAH